jgi:aldose sugar dehydrogenase
MQGNCYNIKPSNLMNIAMTLKRMALSLIIFSIFLLHLFVIEAIEAQVDQHKEGNNENDKIPGRNRDNIWASGDKEREIINAPNLKIEEVARGLKFPTTMAFVGPDDILVLEKENGTVRRIINGNLLPEPVLRVNIATSHETCMCGIAIKEATSGRPYVFLYFTGVKLADHGTGSLANRLYRYELVDNRLQNPKLLLDLPPTAGPHHTGGAILVGPDNYLYLPIGDLDDIGDRRYFDTKAQNVKDSKDADGRSGILRLTLQGKPVPNGTIIGNGYPLNLYYAYGIRNSFGIDFDPVTGKLWDTENGHDYGDEINLVEPGFNSGWRKVQGSWINMNRNNSDIITSEPSDLINFNGTGKYSEPEFEWTQTVGPTALKFFNSNKLGKEYVNDIFVGSVGKGTIYHFDLNNNRTDLALTGRLQDKIADTSEELDESNIVFAKGFGGITDLEVGPYDGYLYVVSIGDGKIFKIVPSAENVKMNVDVPRCCNEIPR